MHRLNASERCIRTFKNNLLVGLSSTDDQFPLHLWEWLILSEMLTLNMLIPLRQNPKMSAHMALKGAFDYNKTPLAPPGTKVVVHKKKKTRVLGSP